ncbi:MAG: DUF459 domain-containing protein [Rhizobiaceae bacterium]
MLQSKVFKLSGWPVVALALLALALPLTYAAPSFAQNSQSLFQRLFKPNRKEQRVKRKTTRSKKSKRRSSRRKNSGAATAKKIPDKLENARIVLVVGDFLAGGLAEGLETAFQESPGIRIVEQSNGSSGIVRDDYYDWRANLPQIIETTNPSVLVIMIGANDRQDFRTTEPRHRRRTDEWLKEYEKRATDLAKISTDRNIPFVWVGVPSFSKRSMTADMLTYNDVYRRVTELTGGSFVDIWDGFVNEAGAYVTSGPDINGQPARLRASDGINVTRAGRRKIAFYAEKPLRKILGDAVAPDIGTLGPENLPQLRLDQGNAPLIDRLAPIALNDPELDGGNELLGATVEINATDVRETPARKLRVEGIAAPAKPGRADDFTWKPQPAETSQ